MQFVDCTSSRRLCNIIAAVVNSGPNPPPAGAVLAARTTDAEVDPLTSPLGITSPLAQRSGITGEPMQSNPFLHESLPTWSGEMTAFEAAARRDLAAAYRLCVQDGLNEGVCNHLTVAMPGNQEFLVVPFGLHWQEVTASRLILVNSNGVVLKGPQGATVEDTAYLIHGAMHAVLGDRGRCIMHTHMPYATTLCALASDSPEPNMPLRMVHQVCGKWNSEICYEREYKGVVDTLNANNPNEGLRLAKSMGYDKRIMFARNHGVFVIGPSVAECFDDLYYLERACRLVVLALSTGKPLQTIGDGPSASVHAGWVATRAEYSYAHFNSRKRLLQLPKPDPFDDLGSG